MAIIGSTIWPCPKHRIPITPHIFRLPFGNRLDQMVVLHHCRIDDCFYIQVNVRGYSSLVVVNLDDDTRTVLLTLIDKDPTDFGIG